MQPLLTGYQLKVEKKTAPTKTHALANEILKEYPDLEWKKVFFMIRAKGDQAVREVFNETRGEMKLFLWRCKEMRVTWK